MHKTRQDKTIPFGITEAERMGEVQFVSAVTFSCICSVLLKDVVYNQGRG